MVSGEIVRHDMEKGNPFELGLGKHQLAKLFL
jgi:hypothetical protein